MYGVDEIAPRPIVDPIDRIADFTLEDDGTGDVAESPCPFLIETSQGIEVYRHPDAFLLEDERLWSIVHEWRSGTPHELRAEDYKARSAWWLTAWSVMRGAEFRWQEKQHREFLDERGNRDAEGGP